MASNRTNQLAAIAATAAEASMRAASAIQVDHRNTVEIHRGPSVDDHVRRCYEAACGTVRALERSGYSKMLAPDLPQPPIRRFVLHRDVDETGISGTGAVAEGVIFASGKVVISWLTALASVAVYDSLEDAQAIHGHNGATRFVFG